MIGMRNEIDTERMRLINCDEEIIRAILESDSAVAKLLNINVATSWTENDGRFFQSVLEKITSSPDEKIWWTYLPILKSENLLIGSGGYKGKPDENGRVEIGYEVALHYRKRGLATEMAEALIDFAFRNESVSTVIAHTLPEENASVKVLRKCGLQLMGEDREDGGEREWRWVIIKESFQH